jgi:fermentation-respiration switch protein FrsA (DUF1100 family)
MYKVSFPNQFKMNVAGHLFIPKSLDTTRKNAAIIVGHPMGAVKEQSADVYASNMAERGFITLAIDLSYWVRAEVSHVTLLHQKCMLKISVQQLTFWALVHL